MNKCLFFFLVLSTNLSMYGMKKTNGVHHHKETVIGNADYMPQITRHICFNHDYKPFLIKDDIRALYTTNTFFHNYYAQETVKKELISLCCLHNDSSHKATAYQVGCHSIYTTIKHLTTIASDKRRQFTQENFQDPWYLTIQTDCFNHLLKKLIKQPLWQIAINHNDLTKAKILIEHTPELHANYHNDQNILLTIAEKRHRIMTYDVSVCYKTLHQLFSLAQQLLEKKILPDKRPTEHQRTPLMYAVENKDKIFARLLLHYNANPYERYHNMYTGTTGNAFDLDAGKPWLKEMIDKVNQEKTLNNTYKGS